MIWRQLAAGGGGRVWAAYQNRYEVELWDTAGRRLRRLARDAEWFDIYRSDEFSARNRRHLLRERERGNRLAPSLQYPPRVTALEQDGRGRLWTLVSVAPEKPEDRRNTIVEVIDPAAGRIVASRRFPMAVAGFAAPGLVTVRERREEDDVEIVKIFRLKLVEE